MQRSAPVLPRRLLDRRAAPGAGLGAIRRLSTSSTSIRLRARRHCPLARFVARTETIGTPARAVQASCGFPRPARPVATVGGRAGGSRIRVLVADGLGHGPPRRTARAAQQSALFQKRSASRRPCETVADDAWGVLRAHVARRWRSDFIDTATTRECGMRASVTSAASIWRNGRRASCCRIRTSVRDTNADGSGAHVRSGTGRHCLDYDSDGTLHALGRSDAYEGLWNRAILP